VFIFKAVKNLLNKMEQPGRQMRLKWSGHQPTLISLFDSLLSSECCLDVTLAADGQFLKAHRLVLCACSSFFQVI